MVAPASCQQTLLTPAETLSWLLFAPLIDDFPHAHVPYFHPSVQAGRGEIVALLLIDGQCSNIASVSEELSMWLGRRRTPKGYRAVGVT